MAMDSPCLAGDVGGTKTLLQLLAEDGTVLRTDRFDSTRYPDLSTIVLEFLSGWSGAAPQYAAFGVAGPVVEGACVTTNLPWHLEENTLAARCNLEKVKLLNDFEATAYGVLQVPPSSLATLQTGKPREHGAIAVMGAGTGLGEALLVWVEDLEDPAGGAYTVVPTEGGHADFAPRDDIEIELFRWLRKRFGRVSWERVVSGQGIYNVYQFLRDSCIASESLVVAGEIAKGDPGAVIGSHALAGTDVLCLRTIDLFIASYGAEAGNLALKGLTTGGVYIAGGIAPKLLPKLQDGQFLRSYRDKGRLSHLVEKAPVHVVLDQEVGLHGAAYAARRMAKRYEGRRPAR